VERAEAAVFREMPLASFVASRTGVAPNQLLYGVESQLQPAHAETPDKSFDLPIKRVGRLSLRSFHA